MAKKRKIQKTTPEEEAWQEETRRLARERIVWREAKEREMEAARAAQQKS